MNDDKIKEIRVWAKTILTKSKEDSDFFDNGVVEAAEFILRETKPSIPEEDFLFRKAEHPEYGEVTIISEKVVEGFGDALYLHAVRRDPNSASGTVTYFFKLDELDFYPEEKKNPKTRLDFHTLKTGTVVKASKDGQPLVAVKLSINSWKMTGFIGSYYDQDMADIHCEWEAI